MQAHLRTPHTNSALPLTLNEKCQVKNDGQAKNLVFEVMH